MTPGHEIAGRVDEPGHPRHGERVAVYIPVFCGRCEECAAGRTHLCRESRDLVGWQRPGGYAERLAVPERCLLPLPDDIPDRLAPLLLDTIGTTAHGVRLARRVVEGGRALVLGAGPIGLGAIVVLARMGFGPIDGRRAQRLPGGLRRLARRRRRPPRPPRAVTGWWSRRPARMPPASSRWRRSGRKARSCSSASRTLTETRSIRLKDFFLIRSFYFPIGDYEANLELLRADRAAYERLVDDRRTSTGSATSFSPLPRARVLKPLMLPI